MQKLRNSGYSRKFRSDILLSTLNGFRKIKEAANNGNRPLYRKISWKKKERIVKKATKKKDWLGRFWKSRIFVPYTPGNKLKKRLQVMEKQMRSVGRESQPIKVIETSRKTLENQLKPPAAAQMCAAKQCLARDKGEPKIGC